MLLQPLAAWARDIGHGGVPGDGIRAHRAYDGDQLVTVRIVLPDTIDEKLAYFMSEWRQSHRYDPGRS